MDNKPINKAAYKQAALQIAAGIRRMERGEDFLYGKGWSYPNTVKNITTQAVILKSFFLQDGEIIAVILLTKKQTLYSVPKKNAKLLCPRCVRSI